MLKDKYNITFVIPNFNYKDRVCNALESAISSLLTYRYSDLPHKGATEIIVVDDCSTDGSYENVSGWCSNKYKDLKVLHNMEDTCRLQEFTAKDGQIRISLVGLKENQGPAKARNVGIEYGWGTTDVYFMLDSDDYIYPNKVYRIMEEYLKDPINVGIIYNDYKSESEDGSFINEYPEPFSRPRILQECICNGNCMIASPVFELCGLYDEGMRTAEDWDLWIRASEKFMILHIAEQLQAHYIHSLNSTNTVPTNVWNENWAKIRERYGQ